MKFNDNNILLLHSNLGQIVLNPKPKKSLKDILKIVQIMFCKWRLTKYPHYCKMCFRPKTRFEMTVISNDGTPNTPLAVGCRASISTSSSLTRDWCLCDKVSRCHWSYSICQGQGGNWRLLHVSQSQILGQYPSRQLSISVISVGLLSRCWSTG